MQETIKYLKEIINNNDSIVVACSGGPDSMCLLSLVCELRKNLNVNVICAHVNHNLRRVSEKEKIFVENYCLKNNIIFEYLNLTEFKTEKFSEQLGHNKRYDFFKETAIKYNAKYVCTAHHGDDLIETILMRITRGSNLSGYLGFKKETNLDSFTLIRPLISVTKKEILEYCLKNNISYVTDKSNMDKSYTRNRYRLNILPYLKEEDENIHLKYKKFSEELENYDEFIKTYVNNLGVININNEIDIKGLINETDFIKRKVIEEVIRRIQSTSWLDISDNQINGVLKLLSGNNRSINLNSGYKATKTYDKLIIREAKGRCDFNFVFNGSLKTDDWELKEVNKIDDDSNFVIRLNSKELMLPLIVRNRINGDKMNVLNMVGTKKISDILIDEKVELEKRDIIPVLTDSNNEVLWIAGVKKSKFAKDINEKYDIIIKYEAR
ncbi:MAG: tRNA lysidine(34) synthetase TilS [Bacilli bacterium]